MIWLAVAAWAADCPHPTLPSQVEQRLDEAEGAYVELDERRFLALTDQLLVATPCLGEVLPVPTTARLHRAVALRLFATRRDDALASLAAARTLAPQLGVDGFVADSHPLAEAWRQAPVEATSRVPLPKGVSLWFDGTVGGERPDERTTLLQVSTDDVVTTTALLFPSDPLPDYPHVPPARRPLQIAAAGSALAAIGAFTLASVSARQFDQPGYSASELEELQRRTNASVIASAALGAGALGALVASVRVR